ncbi:MAG: hypothetical protein JWR61_5824 [Ferruginibacter sp.]|uniref:hypothetical protein n=1 Tax=Ferruginibacter sp. TaxID=1940288 RepID=UPI0026596369|nr:hypothetical protein [Ferruginibacter sp.]MDB5280869.1 hypothetical protein [Ferruginibacter sp.]
MLDKVVWWAQWPMIVVLPLWLFIGTEWLAGDGLLSLLLLLQVSPFLFVGLLATAVLSVAARRARNRPKRVYLGASIASWVLVFFEPFVFQQGSDTMNIPPAFAERLGLAADVDQLLEWGIPWLAFALIIVAWVAVLMARGHESPTADRLTGA